MTFPEEVTFSRRITEGDVDEFSRLCGDRNPLHMDREFAIRAGFERRVVHGLLLASLFSRMAGMELGTERVLYLSQTLEFRSPVFAGDEVNVAFRKKSFSEASHTVTYETTISRGGTLCVKGEARIKLL